MSATEPAAHDSLIQTPQQLAVVILLSFFLPVIVILLLVQLVLGGIKTDPAGTTSEAVAERIKPVAQVVIAAGDATGGAAKTGEQVY